jgi:hypothetical protein
MKQRYHPFICKPSIGRTRSQALNALLETNRETWVQHQEICFTPE